MMDLLRIGLLVVGSWLALMPAAAQLGMTDIERARQAGILLVGNNADPKALDPQLVTGVVESKILTALFEGLCGDDPADDDGCTPGVAERWSANTDFTEWTFHLNRAAKWSDGTPLTARDFLFSYERMLHPSFAAPYVEMLYFIRGAEDFNKGKSQDFASVGVRAPDPHTLVISLREKVPFLPSITRHYTWFPIPEHVVRKFGGHGDRFTAWTRPENIQSNGPFRLKEWRVSHIVETTRNPYYWDAANVALNGIRFYPTENPYTEARAFLAGQLHTIYSLPADQIPWVKKNHPEFLKQDPYLGTVFVRLNVKRHGLDDPRVREALSLALDRSLLCQHILEGYTPARSMTPPMGDYRAKEVLRQDVERAQKLMAEAGYPGGAGFPRLSMLIGRASGRANAEAVQSMWRDSLGVIVDLQNMEWSAYLTAQQTLNFDMAMAGWIGDYLDPTTFLYMWTDGNGNNNTGWVNKEYESILTDAASRNDPNQRLQRLSEAEEILTRELPAIPLAWYSRNYLHHPSVLGWHPLVLDNHPWKTIHFATPTGPSAAP